MAEEAPESATVLVVPTESASPTVTGDEGPGFRPFDALFNGPGYILEFTGETFRTENILGMVYMTAGTAGLIATDGWTYERSMEVGDAVGLEHRNEKTLVGHFHAPVLHNQVSILELPSNKAGVIYFMGNGWAHALVISGFLGYGVAAGSNRALHTASQILEGLASNGLVVVALKMASGRESPQERTSRNGTWRPFRNPSQFFGHAIRYDAMPSGHLANYMSTVTIIAENYPEQKWINPLAYLLMVPLGFQMVNSGVHWYSDYPLGIYMGYTFGKIVARGGKPPARPQSRLVPIVDPLAFRGGMGLRLRWGI